MGPLNLAAHQETVLQYIETGQEEGATLTTSGTAPDRPGYYVAPTVFADVEPEMRIAQEEIFGPVLTVLPFDTETDAVEIANGVEFGLTSGVFTSDVTRAHRVADQLEAGTVYINEWFGDRNNTPFGGMKKSGIGREKGLAALDSYLETKNVTLNLTEESPAVPSSR